MQTLIINKTYQVMRSIITAIFTLFLIQLICAQTGKVGIGTETPGSLLHLYTTENTKIGLSIDAQGVSASQHGYLELITLGNGTQKLGAQVTSGGTSPDGAMPI